MIIRSFKTWIKWWVGTDALKLAMYPPGDFRWHIRIFFERILWKLIHRFFQHWVNTEKQIPFLIEFGIKRNRIEVHEVFWNKTIYPKKKHKGINIIVYLPIVKRNQKYKDWIYGKNLIDLAMAIIKNVNWIILDGKKDMSKIYPITDYYIKINKHRASDINRIAKECSVNDIPVFFTDYLRSDVINARNFAEIIRRYIEKRQIPRKIYKTSIQEATDADEIDEAKTF